MDKLPEIHQLEFVRFCRLMAEREYSSCLCTPYELTNKFRMIFTSIKDWKVNKSYYTCIATCIVTDRVAALFGDDTIIDYNVIQCQFQEHKTEKAYKKYLAGWACQEFGNRTI